MGLDLQYWDGSDNPKKVSTANPLPVDTEIAAAPNTNALVSSPGLVAVAGLDAAALNGYRTPYVYALNGDGRSPNFWALFTMAFAHAYNETDFDRLRTNTQGTLLASAARTATVSSADQLNINAKALHVVLDVTNAGTGSITLTIEAKDAASGKYYPLLTGTAVAANGTTVYRVGPGLAAAANAVANDLVPRTWRVTVTHGNANPITYSVGFGLVL